MSEAKKEEGPDLVVAAYVRGRWSWLRVVDKLTIGNVTTPASTITCEMGDRRQASVWKSSEREKATAYAHLVKGIVVRADWVPPSTVRVVDAKSA